eukprot:7570120-Prorocentrum_lima.AAC.1
MHYMTRNTSKDTWTETSTKGNNHIKQEQEDEPSLSSVLGALMWTAFRTGPDICWAVTRVSRAA